MDENQFITYKILCCTFLLGLVNKGRSPNSKLKSYYQQAILEENNEHDMKELTEKLKVRGGQDQLLMFLTGPTGARKNHYVQSDANILILSFDWHNLE